MSYFYKFLPFLIDIKSASALDRPIIQNFIKQRDIELFEDNSYSTILSGLGFSTQIPFDNFNLIIQGLWKKVHTGLFLSDIENLLFLLIFIRFIIIASRYNLKTSLYINCTGIIAGYLWYKHLIDLILNYKILLIKVPIINNLGIDAIKSNYLQQQIGLNTLQLKENIHWYNPGQIIYYAIRDGIINSDPETGSQYYIDPISMFISTTNEPIKSIVYPTYYKIYNEFIPKTFSLISFYWNQLSGILSYTIITRIGKKYCPYLIRWHWTFLLLLQLVEPIIQRLVYRIEYFQNDILIPKITLDKININLTLQVTILTGLIAIILLIHVGLVILGLFHATACQYFYTPLIVESTELHIGLKPIGLYSGGFVAWQHKSEKERKLKRKFPRLWYGWFGNGYYNTEVKLRTIIKRVLKKQFKRLRKLFSKFLT